MFPSCVYSCNCVVPSSPPFSLRSVLYLASLSKVIHSLHVLENSNSSFGTINVTGMTFSLLYWNWEAMKKNTGVLPNVIRMSFFSVLPIGILMQVAQLLLYKLSLPHNSDS
jgi:hypothetical protein